MKSLGHCMQHELWSKLSTSSTAIMFLQLLHKMYQKPGWKQKHYRKIILNHVKIGQIWWKAKHLQPTSLHRNVILIMHVGHGLNQKKSAYTRRMDPIIINGLGEVKDQTLRQPAQSNSARLKGAYINPIKSSKVKFCWLLKTLMRNRSSLDISEKNCQLLDKSSIHPLQANPAVSHLSSNT